MVESVSYQSTQPNPISVAPLRRKKNRRHLMAETIDAVCDFKQFAYSGLHFMCPAVLYDAYMFLFATMVIFFEQIKR